MAGSWRHVSREICADLGYEGCDQEVIAFHPREVDPPYAVTAEIGGEVLAEACDNCGTGEYERVKGGVRCTGCDYIHRTFRARGCEVVHD